MSNVKIQEPIALMDFAQIHVPLIVNAQNSTFIALMEFVIYCHVDKILHVLKEPLIAFRAIAEWNLALIILIV